MTSPTIRGATVALLRADDARARRRDAVRRAARARSPRAARRPRRLPSRGARRPSFTVAARPSGAGSRPRRRRVLIHDVGTAACTLQGYPTVALAAYVGGPLVAADKTPAGYLGGLAPGSTLGAARDDRSGRHGVVPDRGHRRAGGRRDAVPPGELPRRRGPPAVDHAAQDGHRDAAGLPAPRGAPDVPGVTGSVTH